MFYGVGFQSRLSKVGDKNIIFLMLSHKLVFVVLLITLFSTLNHLYWNSISFKKHSPTA